MGNWFSSPPVPAEVAKNEAGDDDDHQSDSMELSSSSSEVVSKEEEPPLSMISDTPNPVDLPLAGAIPIAAGHQSLLDNPAVLEIYSGHNADDHVGGAGNADDHVGGAGNADDHVGGAGNDDEAASSSSSSSPSMIHAGGKRERTDVEEGDPNSGSHNARYYDVDAAKVDDGTLTEKIDALALTENKPIQGLFEVFVAKPEVPKNTGLEIFRQALLARHGPNPSFETQVLFLTKQLHELLEAPMPSSIVEDRTGKENRVLDWFFHTSSSSDVLIMFGKAQDRLKRHVFGQAVFRLSVALAIRLMSRYGVDPWGHLYAAGSSLSLSGMFTRARRVWAPVTMDDGRGLVFIGDRLAKQEKANILRLSQIAGALLRRGDILNALDIDRGCVVALASMGSQNAELVMEFLAGIVRVRGVPVEFILPRDTLLLCSFAERMDVFLAMLKTVEGSPLFQQIARQKGDEFHAVLVRLFVQRRPWQFGDDALRVLLAARLPFFFSHIILQPAMENATLSEELGCAIIAKAEEFRLLATILAFSNSVRYIDCYLARPDVSDLPPESFNWHVAYAIRLHSSLLFPEPDRRYPKKLMLLRLAPRCADSELLLSLLSMDRLDAVDAFFREDAAAIVSGLLVEGSRDQIRAFFASKMVQDMPLASPKVAAALFSPLTGQEVGIHLDRAMMIIDEALMHGLDRDVLGFLFLEARSTSFRLALLQKYDIQLTDYEWDKTRQSSPELSDDIAAHRARQAAEADARRAKEDEEAVTKSRRLKQAVY